MNSTNQTASALQTSSELPQINVLLVDDRPANLISLESLLLRKNEGINYLLAGSGEQALKIALEEELALILLDVQMPGMNGYEVARYLRNSSRTRDIPIIFVTAIDENASHLMEGFEAGAVDFLFKPLHPFITKAKVSAFVHLYRQKKALEKAHRSVLSLNEELEARVEERTEELTRKNRDLDNFIYTASHDLKAPISNIEGLMQLLYKALSEESKQSEKVISIQEMISESIERFKTTIKDLTEVAKIQNDASVDADVVDFEELYEEVKSDISSAIESSGALLGTDFSRVPQILYSRKNLRSILYNLISNAVKYRSPHRAPIVQVSTWIEDGFIVLEVKDNGLGIKKEDQEKVFGMFKRLHTHVEGTGVGMAIVKRIIENSGGSIYIDSEADKGSTFTVYFKV